MVKITYCIFFLSRFFGNFILLKHQYHVTKTEANEEMLVSFPSFCFCKNRNCLFTPDPSMSHSFQGGSFFYRDFVSGECRRRVMHNPKKGARHGQKRKRRKERKEAKERKEGKEKTIPGFISKPNISTACTYARVRGAANRGVIWVFPDRRLASG